MYMNPKLSILPKPELYIIYTGSETFGDRTAVFAETYFREQPDRFKSEDNFEMDMEMILFINT